MVRALTVSMLGFFLLFATSACTRKATTNASIQLNLGGFLEHAKALTPNNNLCVGDIIINVTAPDIATPVYYHWSGHGGGNQNGCPPVPDPVNVSVPNGSARLVQAIVVFSGQSGGGELLYGDNSTNLATLAGGDADVAISVGFLGNVGNDQISGRYLNADGVSGPSGTINVYFTPPNAPKMLVDNSQAMVNGWFNTFAIAGAYHLDYVINDVSGTSTDLFAGAVGTDSSSLLGPGPTYLQAASVYTPDSWSAQNGGGSLSELAPGTSVYGYFGPGAASKEICYNSGMTPLVGIYTTSAGSTLVDWNGTSSSATDAHPISGGVGVATTSGSPCTAAGNLYVDFLSLNENQVLNGHGALGFQGPFLALPGGSGGGGPNLLNVSYSPPSLTVGWTFLPQVQSTATTKGVDGVDIFARANPANGISNGPQDFQDNNNGVLCSNLLNLGFSFLQSEPASLDNSAATTAYNVTISSVPTVIANGFSSGSGVVTIACPYSNGPSGKIYFDTAAVGYSGGGPGGGPMYMLNFQAGGSANTGTQFASSNSTQQVGSCKLYNVSISMNGSPANATSNVNVGLTSQTTGVAFYSNAACTGGTISGVTIASGSSSSSFYVLAPASAANGNLNLNATGSNMNFQNNNWYPLYFVPSAPTAASQVNINLQYMSSVPTLVTGQCYPVQVSLQDATMNPTYVTTAGTNFSLTVGPTPAAGTFYTDSACSTSSITMPFSFPVNEAVDQIYFLPTAASTGVGTTSVYAVAPPVSSQFSSPQGMTIDAPSPVVYMLNYFGSPFTSNGAYYDGTNWWAPPGCSQVNLSAYSSHYGMLMGSNMPAPSAQTVNLTSGAAFYTNSTCTSASTTSTTLNSNGPFSPVYFKNSGTSFVFNIGGGSNITSYVEPAAVDVQATGTSACNSTGCSVGILVTLRDENGAPYNTPLSGNIQLNAFNPLVLASTPPVSVCSGSGNLTLGLAISANTATAAVCTNSSSGSGAVSASFNGVYSNQVNITAVSGAGGAMSGVALLGPVPPNPSNVSVKAGACEQVTAIPVDSAGHWVNSSGTGTLSGSALPYAFMNNSCSTAASSVSYSGTSATPLYFKDTTTGTTVTLDVTATGTTSINLTPQ